MSPSPINATSSTLSGTGGQPVEWTPPSKEIQNLFKFDPTPNTTDPPSKNVTASSAIDENEPSFTEDEFAKMPSTLMKAVKRTDALLLQTEAARKAAIESNNELKGIHSLLVRYAKKMLKDAEKIEAVAESNLEKGKTRGFRRKCRISDVMCEFMGLAHESTSSRVDVNQAIHDYVKKNGLIDAENAQRIIPDEKLWSLLSEDATNNKITYFSIQKYIKHHFVNVR
jgi:chromatin remodeling complex protein RSC6